MTKDAKIIFTNHAKIKLEILNKHLGMKVRYNREEDILLIEGSDEKIDYAEEMGPHYCAFYKE